MTVQDLLDERAIAHQLNRFARIADGRDWGAVGDVFANDLTFDYGLGEQAGIDAMRALLQRFLDPCGPSQHLLGSIVIEVRGDEASSRAYVQARHQGAGDKAARFFDTNGEYVDRWKRMPEGWRIIRRDVTWAMHMGDPTVLAP
ncbi:nuclear transport factor 2 family protein [Azospirillum sp. 412522]|nr:nuclear transport factor 2 family protein [Azospirillum sp. 412522]MBY6262051.1 nuclear transport factor 2 family protein [Azospirillum sp. 412522]